MDYTRVEIPLPIAQAVDKYNILMATNAEPRTADWFLLQGFGPTLMILVSYIYFCTHLGPRYMRNKKPYDLKTLLLFYNLFHIVACTWMLVEVFSTTWWANFDFRCQPVDYSGSELAFRMARLNWVYFMCKLVDLLDTVIFVFRKKDNQLTTLHLYHHTVMPIFAWVAAKFLPGGYSIFPGVINAIIHVIMYVYYFVAALGPQYQKYIWWKKYLTTMQMIQFLLIIAHQVPQLIYECNYPRTFVFLQSINTLILLYMFAALYVQTYMSKNKAKIKSKDK